MSRQRVGGAAWWRVTAWFAIASLMVAGCGMVWQGCGSIVGQPACTHGPTGAPGGLSQDAAIAAARRLAPAAGADPTVVWASIEHDPFAPQGASDARLVWEVRLQGSFVAAPCPSGFLDVPPLPAESACVDDEAGLVVVLDYSSGAFVGWMH